MKSDPTGNYDSTELAALGYTAQFNRTMSLWENFALGFTYLSPVVGAYTLLAFGLSTGGPPMIWSYFLAAVGMMMVCLVFGEVVSQFPIAGGVYPWARRLMGKRWSWITGWIYGWAMYATIAGVAEGAAGFVAPLLGIEVNPASVAVVALVTIGLATFFNVLGTRVLAKVAMVGFLCEMLGAVVVGGWLLSSHRLQPLSVFFNDFGISLHGSYLPAFLSSALVGMFCCYGFEACGDLAEETPDPSRQIPKAMRMTIYIGISVTVFSVTGLVLAIPDMHAVLSGAERDPVALILSTAFGPRGYRVILCVVLVSFLSCVLSLQAAVSRLVFAYARDNMIVGSSLLSKISPRTHVPVPSLVLAGLLPGAIICAGYFAQSALATVVSFAAVGIYLAFQMVVVAALYARFKGWQPSGKFQLGRWAWAVNVLALLYGTSAAVNLVWPRAEEGAAWYVGYVPILTVTVVVGAGLLYLKVARPERHGVSPAGDAWMLHHSNRVPLESDFFGRAK